MKIVQVPLGTEGNVEVDFTMGNLVIEMDETTAGLKGGLNVSIPVTYFIDALAAKLGPSGAVVGQVIDGLLKAIP